jgi:hypothetical protein
MANCMAEAINEGRNSTAVVTKPEEAALAK